MIQAYSKQRVIFFYTSILLLCAGYSILAWRDGAIAAFVHMNYQVSAETLVSINFLFVVGMLLASLWVVWKNKLWAFILQALFLVGYVVIDFANGGKWFAEFHLPAALVRASGPLLLYAFLFSDVAKNLQQILGRVVMAVVFATHGLVALFQAPDFVDYLIAANQFVFGTYMDQGLAENLLLLIGLVDLLVAALILWRPFKGVLYWAVFWLVLTLFMRLAVGGVENYPQVLIRLPYLGMLLLILPEKWSQMVEEEPALQSIASSTSKTLERSR